MIQIERDYEDEGEFDEDDFPESEWMSEAGVEGEDDDNASVASFATATTFTRMLRKQQKQRAEAGETEVSREDFEAIMDDFLDNYEVVGKKMVQVLPGHSGAEKLDSMRRALVGLDLEGNGAVGAQGQGQDGDEDEMGSLAGGTKREADYIRQRYLREDYYAGRKGEEEKMPMLHIVGQGKEDKWDAETILSESRHTTGRSIVGRRSMLMTRACVSFRSIDRYIFQLGEPPPYDRGSAQGKEETHRCGRTRICTRPGRRGRTFPRGHGAEQSRGRWGFRRRERVERWYGPCGTPSASRSTPWRDQGGQEGEETRRQSREECQAGGKEDETGDVWT